MYDITSGSLLGENSSIDLTVKKYFSVVTQMPSVALCLWISLFMILYALVEGKWRYLLFFIPCLGYSCKVRQKRQDNTLSSTYVVLSTVIGSVI